jgi:hypothetical protein
MTADEPADDGEAWPGAAPPAGWFLRSQAGADARGPNGTARPAMDDGAAGTLAEEWFAPPALDTDESPISWYQDMDDTEGDGQPLASAGEEPDEPGTDAWRQALPEQSPPGQRPSGAAEPGADAWAAGQAESWPYRKPDASWPATPPAVPQSDNTAHNGNTPVPPGTGSPGYAGPAAEAVVSATRALWGRAGGPGFQLRRPGPGNRRVAADLSPWHRSQRLWSESDIQWEPYPADDAYEPSPAELERFPSQEPDARPPWPYANPPAPAASLQPVGPPGHPAAQHNWSGSPPPAPVDGAWPRAAAVPLGAPVFAEPESEPETDPEADPQADPETDLETDPEAEPQADYDLRRATDGPPPLWDSPDDTAAPLSAGDLARPSGSLLLEPELPGSPRPRAGRRRVSRRTATIALPAMVLVAVGALALALLTGHGPKFGSPAANQQETQSAGPKGNQGTPPRSPLTIGMYAGQQQRGVFQTINRIVASGNTMVTMGSQTSDGVVRQQFFVSSNGGASWRLAPVHAPGGGQPPVGYPAARLAGGPGGWVAVGPQAIWTSPDGLSWTLAATHGITPQLPGDQMWVLNSTAQGFVAAGVGAAGGGRTQAVIWTSSDGLTWQRKTAEQLGLAGPGEWVQSISYATSRGADTVISGTVIKGGRTYSGAWLSTDGGSTWARVTVPVDHGAGAWITGLGFDGSGLIAVRPGRSASGADDGVAYFSPNGQAWQYAAIIDAAGGWIPTLVKGSDYGFVVTGASAAGQIVAYTATGTGTVWQPTAPLGDAAEESVVGATVGPAGTIIAIGYTAGSKVSQQPVFLEANTAGSVRPVSLAGAPGATVPELAVNGLAISDGQQVAVGSVDGYPAIWRKASSGSWALVSSLSQVSGEPALRTLTGVTHGSAGWLAVGAPGPLVFTSADGTTWQPASGPGSITDDLAGVSAVAVAAGPAGYVIVGKLVAPGGACVADVWWSPNLTSWTRAHDVNDVNGSSQVLSVAADAHGFVSVGSHNGKPAVWTTTDGRSWTTIVLPVPAGASSAVLQQIAINGDRLAALGQETTTGGIVPFAELSVNRGTSWSQVPFSPAGPDTAFTALTADSGGFTAAGQFGEPGQRQIALWTSANGTTWAPSPTTGITSAKTSGSYQITALAPSGSAVTGIGSIATQARQEVFTVTLPAR